MSEPDATAPAGQASWRRPRVSARSAAARQASTPRVVLEAATTTSFQLNRAAGILARMGLMTLCAAAACAVVGRLLCTWIGGSWHEGCRVAALGLIPGTAAMALLLTLLPAPQVAPQRIFTATVVAGVGVSVVAVWLLLLGGGWLRARPARPNVMGRLGLVLLGALATVSFQMRYSYIGREPLSPDEMRLLLCAKGVLARGYPSFEIDANLPLARGATSELVSYAQAPFVWYFENERVGLRFASVLFETGTTLLLFALGARLFNRDVGLVASCLHAFAPRCLVMANFARYFSQLAFLALLCVYLMLRLIEHPRRLSPGRLWVTVVAFLAMYLTWEGSAFLALGLSLTAVWRYRRRLQVLVNGHVAAGCVVVVLAILTQLSYRTLGQIERPLLGTGATDVSFRPMWRYRDFDPLYYLQQATWNDYALVPVAGLLIALVLPYVPRWRKGVTPLLIILVTTALVQASMSSVKAWRYSYHLLPLLILIDAAVIVWLARSVQRLAGRSAPWPWRAAARVAALSVMAAALVGASTTQTDPSADALLHLTGRSPGQAQFAHAEAAAKFVQARLEPDDIVMATTPHLVDAYLGRPSDYWLHTRLLLQATLNDVSPTRRHKLAGTPLIPDLEALRNLLQRHRRVWYVCNPRWTKINHAEVVEYVRKKMDIVYEDHHALVFLYDQRHRPEAAAEQQDRVLRRSGLNPLR